MSERIAPIDPIPAYQPLAVKTKGKKKDKYPSEAPAIRPLVTGHFTPLALANDRDAIKAYLRYHCRQLALELAHRRGRLGVNASDIRLLGASRGLWSNRQFDDRSFSFLSSMLKYKCGLVHAGRENARMSEVEGARNMNEVYVLPQYAGQRRAG